MSAAARAIATGLGIGHAPYAPGTCASLATLPLGFACHYFGGVWLLASVLLLLVAAGFWAAGDYLQGKTNKANKDPPEIVIDEICGQMMVLLIAAPLWFDYLAAFLFFRFFDIVKPWPVRQAEQKLSGAGGIMTDDLIAALLAAFCLQGLKSLLQSLPLFLG